MSHRRRSPLNRMGRPPPQSLDQLTRHNASVLPPLPMLLVTQALFRACWCRCGPAADKKGREWGKIAIDSDSYEDDVWAVLAGRPLRWRRDPAGAAIGGGARRVRTRNGRRCRQRGGEHPQNHRHARFENWSHRHQKTTTKAHNSATTARPC